MNISATSDNYWLGKLLKSFVPAVSHQIKFHTFVSFGCNIHEVHFCAIYRVSIFCSFAFDDIICT